MLHWFKNSACSIARSQGISLTPRNWRSLVLGIPKVWAGIPHRSALISEGVLLSGLAGAIFRFSRIRIYSIGDSTPARLKGRVAIVTKRGLGCGGRDGVGRETHCGAAPWECVSKGCRVNDTALAASSHGLD